MKITSIRMVSYKFANIDIYKRKPLCDKRFFCCLEYLPEVYFTYSSM